MFRRIPLLMAALLFVDFLDEFSAGMPTVGIPGIESTFDLSYTTAAFFVFTAPLLVGFLLEPPLFVLADRFQKKHFIVGGLLAMALLDFVVGLSNTFVLVAAALTLSGVASGCGVSLSQAALMDTFQDDRERLMTRWTLMGACGDLAAPLLFWGLAAFALGWREAFLATGAILGVYALFLARTHFTPAGEAAEQTGAAEEEPGLREVLRAALGSRRLMIWLVGVWLCSLLDELLIAFGALWMREHLGADTATRSGILTCMMAGGIVGLLLLDRVLGRRADALALLKVASVGTAAAYAGWLVSGTALAAGACMFFVGLFSAPLYPIAMAQAYRALPGRSGMVNAIGHVFTPLDVLLPLLLGAVADEFGLVWALAVLIAQPVGLAAIAFLAPAAPPAPAAQASRIG